MLPNKVNYHHTLWSSPTPTLKSIGKLHDDDDSAYEVMIYDFTEVKWVRIHVSHLVSMKTLLLVSLIFIGVGYLIGVGEFFILGYSTYLLQFHRNFFLQ